MNTSNNKNFIALSTHTDAIKHECKPGCKKDKCKPGGNEAQMHAGCNATWISTPRIVYKNRAHLQPSYYKRGIVYALGVDAVWEGVLVLTFCSMTEVKKLGAT